MGSQAGTLAYVKVNNDPASGENFCLFGLIQSNGSTEHIFLWFAPAGAPQPTATDWILRNAQIALLRDAFVNKLPVLVFTDTSSQVTSIQLGAAASGESFV